MDIEYAQKKYGVSTNHWLIFSGVCNFFSHENELSLKKYLDFNSKSVYFVATIPQFSQFALDIGHQRQVDTGAGLVPSLVQDRMSELHK